MYTGTYCGFIEDHRFQHYSMKFELVHTYSLPEIVEDSPLYNHLACVVQEM